MGQFDIAWQSMNRRALDIAVTVGVPTHDEACRAVLEIVDALHIQDVARSRAVEFFASELEERIRVLDI